LRIIGVEDAARPAPSWGEIVDAISALKNDEVSLGEFAAKLALYRRVTSRRVRDAADRGYLVNLETRRGRPARNGLGDPMPEMVKLLPEPGELGARLSVAPLHRWRGDDMAHGPQIDALMQYSGGGDHGSDG
jgi:hypothetical protein